MKKKKKTSWKNVLKKSDFNSYNSIKLQIFPMTTFVLQQPELSYCNFF